VGLLAGAATARQAARAGAPARGRLAATITELLDGADDLHAFGAQDTALAHAEAADTELTRHASRTAVASGLGTGLMSLVSGLTLWAMLLLGVAATGTGALSRVPLAVLTATTSSATPADTTSGRGRTDMNPTVSQVVIVGGGFAGLFAARALRRAPVQVTLIDRAEHHLFQPLLYQCATGILSEGKVASPFGNCWESTATSSSSWPR
jgi:ABC-type multidrug transport system fused ATPase/permease subunit